MDLSLDELQREVVATARSVVRRAGRSSGAVPTLDREALQALSDAGFLDLATTGGGLPEAGLVVEEAAAAGVTAPVGARALVAAAVGAADLPLVVALVTRPAGELVRFGAQADAHLVLDGDRALVAGRDQVEVDPRTVRWGYPVARVVVTGGSRLAPGSGAQLLRAARSALAAEAGALMGAAVRKASAYVTERTQFGRPIGSYQSVQHRLARGLVLAEGTTWLARRALADPDDDLAAAVAAAHACNGMREVFRSVHQVVGAMGVTDEFGLTRLTGKLAYLHTELGGPAGSARAVAAARWPAVAARAVGGLRAAGPGTVPGQHPRRAHQEATP